MFTGVDIVEQRRVPILFSLQPMSNLHVKLDMPPDHVLITCEALGVHHIRATQASSSHIVCDLASLQCKPSRTCSNRETDVP